MKTRFSFHLLCALATLCAGPIARSEVTTQPSININTPDCNNGRIACDSVDGNNCYFSVTGTSSGLTDGDQLALMIKFAGGQEWWQAGNTIKYNDDFTITGLYPWHQ